MPYFFVAQPKNIFIFQVTNMNVEIAKAETLAACKSFLETGSKIEVTICDLKEECSYISSIKPPMLLNQAENEPVYFGIGLRYAGDGSVTESDKKRFHTAFERHFCRKIEVTDFVDQIVITTSVTFGTTRQYAS